MLFFKNWTITGLFFLYFPSFQQFTVNMFIIKSCRCLDSNLGPLVSEATALPQPLPRNYKLFVIPGQVTFLFPSVITFWNNNVLLLFFPCVPQLIQFQSYYRRRKLSHLLRLLATKLRHVLLKHHIRKPDW